ncbi:MAG: hypothetical protein CBC36_11345, partial [Verrucomicrobiaceae bacterium TMED76]
MKIFKTLLTAAAVTSIFLGSTLADHHKKKDIVDTAVSNGNFKTLAAALTAAGLVDTRTVGKLDSFDGSPEKWDDWQFKSAAWLKL